MGHPDDPSGPGTLSTLAGHRERVAAVEGWFTLDEDEPRLLGGRCPTCGTVTFPARAPACPNPACAGLELAEAELSRRGRLWSWATNHYPPPEPYVAPEPFMPYTVAAVELDDERMVVLGQLDAGVDPAGLRVGQPMELALGVLFDDGEREHLVWTWRPVAGEPAA